MSGPIRNQTGPGDESFFSDAVKEVASMFEESITIKRWTGRTTGDVSGLVSGEPQYTLIPATASISELSARELATPATLFRLGDLRAEISQAVFGGESFVNAANSLAGDGQAKGREADRILYRNREYMVQGTPTIGYLAGNRAYWGCYLRQVQ